MLRLLADENIPKKLVISLKRYGVNVARLQDLGTRGISDRELANIANELERTILTRDADFTEPSLLPLIRHGVIYISYQPPRKEIQGLAERIASIANQLEPKPELLIIIDHKYIEIYD
ncbi:MAG: DUF5615 family PIN-like protein [Desulfurococcales archaeon]|nr:DUF5615 family PIN-like protein [Desulfurococcales archaeon]